MNLEELNITINTLTELDRTKYKYQLGTIIFWVGGELDKAIESKKSEIENKALLDHLGQRLYRYINYLYSFSQSDQRNHQKVTHLNLQMVWGKM